MRRALASALLVLLIAPCTAAAEDGRAANALHKGATSLEIGVDAFGGSFASTAEIAARRHFSPAWAVRLAGTVSHGDEHQEALDLQDGLVFPANSDADQTTWGLATQAVWFPVREDDLALLVALGPKYTRGRSSRNQEGASFGSSVRYTSQDEGRTHSLGVGLDLGFEWFVGRRIALHARTGTTYSHSEQQNGFLRTYYDASGLVVDQSGSARELKSNSLSTVEFGLRLVGYF